MTDGANTPTTAEPEFADLGPATRLAIRTGLKACDDAIVQLEDRECFRALSPQEAFDLRDWKDARHKILTQPYPLPYEHGRERREQDSGSQPGKVDPAE